jgi:hypothetical protein
MVREENRLATRFELGSSELRLSDRRVVLGPLVGAPRYRMPGLWRLRPYERRLRILGRVCVCGAMLRRRLRGVHLEFAPAAD